MTVYIQENSWLARIAARQLRSQRAAMVLGKTIYLWGVSRAEFLQTPSWVRHEVAHVYQFKKYGWLRFLCVYLYQTSVRGYYHNPLEQEARSYETETGILANIDFR